MQRTDLLASTFETARAGLVLLDKNSGRILEANAAFLRMAGRPRDAVMNRDFWQPPLMADAEAGGEVFAHLRAGGALEDVELPLARGDGSLVLIDVSGSELAPGVIRLEILDASGRERARLAERMNAQRAMARRVSSEFQELHQVLQAAAEQLVKCARSGQSTFAETDEVRRAADRAASMARELAAYSGQSAMESAPLQLNELIESELPALRQLLGPEIRMIVDLSPDAVPAIADSTLVRQILLKLAANSREAMEKGGLFHIATQNATANDPALRGVSGGQAYTVLTVSDNGPGLDDESWAHLYEPFFTTKTNGRRGLGLAAVHGMVRQSGGRVWADSFPGRGATFRIYLPQAVGESLAPRVHPAIVVVEARDGVRAMVTNILRKHGYRVLATQEVAEAGEIAAGQDARMLVLNGDSSGTHAGQDGAVTLDKPFELDTLLDTARRLVE